MQAGRVAVGHPVDVASGAVFTIKNDFRFPGLPDLVWRRRYDSDAALDSWLGRGWGVPFFMSLARVPEGYLLAAQAGHTVLFPTDERLGVGHMIRNLYANMELRREADAFTVLHWHAGGDPIACWRFWAREWDTMPLAAIEDVGGHAITVEYDGVGRPKRIVQELEHRVVELAYDARDLVTDISFMGDDGSRRLLARYDYDGMRRLVCATDAIGQRTEYAYDAEHRMVAERNALGSTFAFEYDARGRCVLTSAEDGYMLRRLRYQSAPPLTRVEDTSGNVSQYLLNASGQVLQQISPLGAVTTNRYDEFGRRVETVYADGASERFTYDGHGDRTVMVHEDGSETAMTYNDRHQLVSLTDASGGTYTYTYDDRGHVLALTNALGAVFSCQRDERGLVVESRTPGGLVETRQYDARLRWVEARDQFGLIQRIEVDEYGQEVARFDAAGLLHRTWYDVLQRPIEVEDALGVRWRYAWNGLDELTEASSTGGERDLWEYDLFGQVTAQTNSLGRTMRFAYDAEGQMIAAENRAGDRMRWVYDADGRLAAEQFFDGRWQQYEHNLRGDCTRIVRADGREIEQRYDKARQLVRRVSSDGLSESYVYDAGGRMLSGKNNDTSLEFEYDLLGRVTAEVQSGRRVEYAYDQDNNRTVRRLPLGDGDELALSYDARGRLVAFADARGPVQSLAWDSIDRLVRRQSAAGVDEELAYGATRSLERHQVRSARHGVVVSRRYEHDSRGYVAVARDAAAGVTEYEFDVLGRITAARGGRAGEERFAYDPTSAIVETHRGPRTLAPGGRTMDDGERRLTYDEAGCVARIDGREPALDLRYNIHEQLVEVRVADGPHIRYQYDTLGRRVRRLADDGVTEFLWDGCYPAAELRDGSATDRYLFLAWEPLAQWRGAQRLTPVTDRSGAVRELLDEEGALLWRCALDTYGRVVAETGTAGSPFRFHGQHADPATGLHYNVSRTYDPRLGDYLSPDPIGIAGGSNFYFYPRNPILWDDPFGLSCGPSAAAAEKEMDKHFTAAPPKGKGMIKLVNPKATKPKSIHANGIDAVYMDPTGGPPKYVIAEAKSGSATLGWTKDGKVQQMSDSWINGKPGGRGDNRLDKAVGSNQATDIRNSAATPGEVQKVVYSKPDPTKPGSVTQTNDFTNSKKQSF